MPEQAGERTEPATPKRRSDARQRGDVAQSRDVGTVLAIGVAFLFALSAAGARLAGVVGEQAQLLWGGRALHPRTLGDFHSILFEPCAEIGLAALPLLGCLILAGIAGQVAQTGPVFASKAFEIKLERMNPISGLKRFVQPEKVVDLVKALVKLALIVAITWAVLAPSLGGVLALSQAGLRESTELAGLLSRRLVASVLALLAILAAADVAWVRYRHEKKLRMTRQEVRDELIQREGNPHVRGRQRQAARELSRSRLVAEVAKADVVVKNPTHFAVALRYERAGMGAPRVVAKGRNRSAGRILEIAREHEVPIVENPPLARVLYRTAAVGREIPETLYQAVAEVLAYVYRLDRRRAAGWGVS